MNERRFRVRQGRSISPKKPKGTTEASIGVSDGRRTSPKLSGSAIVVGDDSGRSLADIYRRREQFHKVERERWAGCRLKQTTELGCRDAALLVNGLLTGSYDHGGLWNPGAVDDFSIWWRFIVHLRTLCTLYRPRLHS